MSRKNVLILSIALAVGLVALCAFLLLRTQEEPFSLPTLNEGREPEERTPEIPNFVEVIDSCGANHEGSCVNVRMEPSSTSPSLLTVRTGVVLPIAATTTTDTEGRVWYKVHFTEWIRYPDRVPKDWYVAADYVRPFRTEREEVLTQGDVPETNKRILVDRSEQKLYAYEGSSLFLEVSISTGRDLTPTPRGSFTVYRKMPGRYMQGPLPGISDQYYDLPGVPWNLYFTNEGGAIHGAYWHNEFGNPWSHGCVNVPLDTARKLYEWTPLGTSVVVQD